MPKNCADDHTYGCPDGCALHDCRACGAAHAHVNGPHACPSCGVRFPDLYVSVVSADYYRHPREDRTVDPGPCRRCGMADGAIVVRSAEGWACHDRSACDFRSVR